MDRQTYGGNGETYRAIAEPVPARLSLSLDSLSLVALVAACTRLHSLSLGATGSGDSQCLLLVPHSQCHLLVPCHSDWWRRSPPPLPSDSLPSPPLPSPIVPADSYCASPLAALLVGVVLVQACEHGSPRGVVVRACLSSPTPLRACAHASPRACALASLRLLLSAHNCYLLCRRKLLAA